MGAAGTNDPSQSDSAPPTADARHLITVKDTPSSGLGVFATSPIPRATRILSTPLLLSLNGGENPAEILAAVNKLSAADRAAYLALHPFAPPVRKDLVKRHIGKRWEALEQWERDAIGVYDANSFEVGVYDLPSRINHSCIPNVHYEYNPAIERGTFHAVRDIAEGEELFISYINGGSRLKSWRQPKLDMWGFVCQCAACTPDAEGKKREARRKQMFELDQKLARQSVYGNEMTASQALKAATQLAGLQVAEGIANRELRTSYHDAARYCLELGNAKLALLWAEKEYAHEKVCVGDDHPICQAVAARVDLLKDIGAGKAELTKELMECFH
ncbi:TPR domain protein [Paraphaeosphaeria sporulosa]|uniref:TPR domain protein n=1 Tax=Paraphaeosphaeria sporulosa TaxID=1460663 RepID=A0A177CXQ2_9PLEO|nr:TPR domain protein [Paraphaeosphaeria sporulosa]OAG12344.1 TPR domain protein [Paraphaeosphaeria sporulosa]